MKEFLSAPVLSARLFRCGTVQKVLKSSDEEDVTQRIGHLQTRASEALIGFKGIVRVVRTREVGFSKVLLEP